ncbi:MAG: hypothetical protein ACAH80_00125 [Alphaproteobacteria bacterium]
MFDFDAFADMTASFNTAVHGGAGIAANAMAVSTIFSMASAPQRNEDPELKVLKPALKMSLLGMML